MAKMVPSRYKVNTTSYGEQQMFRALEDLPEDYTVLHSIALNGHTGKLFSEIDFIILCPLGVLCLEVKGGRIKCEDRSWYSYGGSEGERREIPNPFTQAQSAAAVLYDEVKNYFKTNRKVTGVCFASAVAFPDITFSERGPEVRIEIVYDKSTGDVLSYINRVFAYWTTEFQRRNNLSLTGLSGNARVELERFLYKNFDIVYTIGTRIKQVELETLRLGDEQKRILNQVGGNPRLLLTGGAGTGKTILCLEQAVRQATKGLQVLFLCFNHNLAFHLHHQISAQYPELLDEGIHVFAFHKYLAKILREGGNLPPEPPIADKQAYSRYWEVDLPQSFLKEAKGRQPQFDLLVVDEGQDLLEHQYLHCLDFQLKGGLKSGQWLFALDPRQNIYRTDLEGGLALLEGGQPAKVTLEDNYRNTSQIIDYTVLSTGIDPQVRSLLQGSEIREDYYSSQEEQKIKLVKALEELKKQEVPPASICILSMNSYEKSVLSGIAKAGKFSIQNLADLYPEDWDPASVKFSSLHRFKGLESPVVILTDVTRTNEEYAARCYTAMTRAQALLWVLKKIE